MSNQYLYSIQDIENNEDLFFNTDELSGSDCYWTDSDSNESAIESENEGNTMSWSVEERPILTPQRRQFLFAARPAAVILLVGLLNQKVMKSMNNLAPPGVFQNCVRLQQKKRMQDPHPITKERGVTATPVTVEGLPVIIHSFHSSLPVMHQIFQACGKTFLHLLTMLLLPQWILGYLHLLVMWAFFTPITICLLLHQWNFFIFFLVMSFGIL